MKRLLGNGAILSEGTNKMGGQDNYTRQGLDIAALTALLGYANNLLPAIATILTIVWTGLRCYEALLAIRQKKADLSKKPE